MKRIEKRETPIGRAGEGFRTSKTINLYKNNVPIPTGTALGAQKILMPHSAFLTRCVARRAILLFKRSHISLKATLLSFTENSNPFLEFCTWNMYAKNRKSHFLRSHIVQKCTSDGQTHRQTHTIHTSLSLTMSVFREHNSPSGKYHYSGIK